MKKILTGIIVFTGMFFCSNAYSQDTIEIVHKVINIDIFEKIATPSNNGKVTLGGDNIKSIIAEVKESKKTPLKGFRIRVFMDNSQNARNKAEGTKNRIKNEYPYLPVYVSHISPNFYVDVGDFRTRDDAEKMKNTLKASYPALRIVPTNIKLPPL